MAENQKPSAVSQVSVVPSGAHRTATPHRPRRHSHQRRLLPFPGPAQATAEPLAQTQQHHNTRAGCQGRDAQQRSWRAEPLALRHRDAARTRHRRRCLHARSLGVALAAGKAVAGLHQLRAELRHVTAAAQAARASRQLPHPPRRRARTLTAKVPGAEVVSELRSG